MEEITPTQKTSIQPQNPIQQFTSGAGNASAQSTTPIDPKQAKKNNSHIVWWVVGSLVAGVIIALVVIFLLMLNRYGSISNALQSAQNSIESKNPTVAKVTEKVVSVLPVKIKTVSESFVSAIMAQGVDEKTGEPILPTTSYTNKIEKYYLVVKTSDAPHMKVKTVWYQNQKSVQEYEVADVSGNTVLSFFLDVQGSTPPARIGDYKAVVYFNDQQIAEVPFHVSAE